MCTAMCGPLDDEIWSRSISRDDIWISKIAGGMKGNQPIRTCYLGHVTGYQPIRDQYFLIRSR